MTTRSWLVPTRRDPLNRLCADWAGFIATVEWLVILYAVIFLTPGCSLGVVYHTPTLLEKLRGWSLIAVVILLTMAGLRGILSRRPRRRLGSLALFATNFAIVLILCGTVIHDFLFYHQEG